MPSISDAWMGGEKQEQSSLEIHLGVRVKNATQWKQGESLCCQGTNEIPENYSWGTYLSIASYKNGSYKNLW